MNLTKGPGDRIESRCTRCQDRTGHIIVAMVGGEIIKVECCACGSTHKYYPIRTEKSIQPTVKRVKAGASRKDVMKTSNAHETRSKSKAISDAIANESAWRKEMERPSAPEARPYSIDMLLAKQDIVNHPHFGLGVVIETIGHDKAKILFKDGTRLLRCSCSK